MSVNQITEYTLQLSVNFKEMETLIKKSHCSALFYGR